jgi:hypothetical protein
LFFLYQYRFHLEPKAALQMPAYNKGNAILGRVWENQAMGVRQEA